VKKIVEFFNDVVAEMKKVVWPSRDKVMDSTRIVIISTIILALFFGLADIVFLRLIQLFF
jgi:preprotein translocase subunit SecE